MENRNHGKDFFMELFKESLPWMYARKDSRKNMAAREVILCTMYVATFVWMGWIAQRKAAKDAAVNAFSRPNLKDGREKVFKAKRQTRQVFRR
jgi:hypothetical protein